MNAFQLTRILPAALVLLLQASQPSSAAVLGTWPVINMGKPSKLFVSGIAYGNNAWVAVGQGGYIATSSDGVTWTRRSAGISRDFNDVVFSGGRFIAVCKAPDTGSGAKIWVSSNGVTWSYRNTDAGLDFISVGLHSVATDGAGNLIAVGGLGWTTRSFDNGESWHVLMPPAKFTSVSLYGVGYGNGVWIAAQNGNGIYRSTDGGATWTSVSTTMGGTHVAFGNNRWLIAGDNNNRLYWSANGQVWKEAKSSPADGGSNYFQFAKGCVFRDGLFVAVTEYGAIWTSENAREFKRWQAAGADPDAWCIAASERKFIAAGGDFTAKYGLGWASPPWLRARLGSSWDYPYTLFDSEDGPVRRIGLPQYRVNTSSLNLLLEGTLFHMKTTGSAVDLRLVYNSSPVKDGSTAIGLFGKNWRLRYESVVGAFGTEAVVITGGGRSLMFSTPNGEDLSTATSGSPITLLPPDGIFDELKFYGPGQYFEYKEKDTKRVNRYAVSDVAGAIWRLTRVTDRNGQQMNLTVDGTNGRIASITNPTLRTVTFTYDTTANLCTQITVPDGRHISFQYDTHKNLTRMTDMAGYIADYRYDTVGFLTSMEVAGRRTTFAFADRPGYEDETSAQDNAGDKILASVKDATGGVTSYAMQPNEGGVKRTDPRGKSTTFKSQKGQTSGVVDPLGRTRQVEYSAAKLPSSTTDAAGKITKYDYDTRGNLVKTTDALGNITAYGYDDRDNLTSETDALGKTTAYLYDGSDRVTRITTPLGHQTNFTYYGNGRLHTIQDARTNTTTFSYNGNGDLASAADPAGGTTAFVYDGLGRALTCTDPRGKVRSFTYDGNDRTLTMKQESLAGTPQRTFAYDAFGETSVTDELGHVTLIQRNELGFATRVEDPLGNTTLTAYDPSNNPVQVTDPLGRITTTTYDEDNRPLVITDAAGKSVRRTYDANGSLLTVTDKNAGKTAFSYDANNRLVQSIDPLGKKVSQTRDKLGRTSITTNARGQAVRLTYDDDGRVTEKAYKENPLPAGTFAAEATYSYDGNGNLTQQVDDWGTSTFVYDANNRVSSITYPTGKTASFTFNAAGLPETVTYPNGLVVTYAYDDFNRVKSPTIARSGSLVGDGEAANQVTQLTMTLGAATKIIGWTYNALGQVTGIDRPGLVADTTCTYDAANRLASLVHGDPLLPLVSHQYGLDAAGNVAADTVSGTLALADPLPDAATSTYNLASQVKQRNAAVYSYDADGNLTGISGGRFTAAYTPENLPTDITRLNDSATETIHYTYDAAGMRVKRAVTGGATTQFHYGPGGQLLFTTDGAGTMTAAYIWKGSTLAAMLTETDLDTDIRYPLHNHLGSVVAVLNPAGTADTAYAYQPYGGLFRQENPGSNDPGLFTFVGGAGVQDEGAGLFYMQNRFYDSVTGRFLQRDPKGLEGGLNLYAYASQNPVNRLDPAGLEDVNFDYPDQVMSGTYDINRNVMPVQMGGSEASDEEVFVVGVFGVAVAGAAVITVAAPVVAEFLAAEAVVAEVALPTTAEMVAANAVELNAIGQSNALRYLISRVGSDPALARQVVVHLNQALPTLSSSTAKYSMQCVTRIIEHMAAGGL